MSRVQYAARTYLIASGETVEVARDSAFLTCLSASGSFKITFDDGSETRFEAGLTYKPESGFNRLSARNDGPDPIIVTFGFGKGAITDARVVISSEQQLTTRQKSPDTAQSGVAVLAVNGASTLVVAANDLTREAIIVVPATASGPVYVSGDAAAIASHGLPIQPGQSITLEYSGGVYVRNDTGSDVLISHAALRWSV